MVQIGAQDERAADGGRAADGTNGPADSAGADSSAALTGDAGSAGVTGTPAVRPQAGPGLGSSESTVILGRPGATGARPRPLSPSGSLPPDLLSLDKPLVAASAEPAPTA